MNTILLLLIGVPIVEIYLFIKMGSQIGAFNTILLIFITAFLGIIYARYEGFNTLRAAISQIVKNELPVNEIISGEMVIPVMEKSIESGRTEFINPGDPNESKLWLQLLGLFSI